MCSSRITSGGHITRPSASARTITPTRVEHVVAHRLGILVRPQAEGPHAADATGVIDHAVGGERVQAAAQPVLDVLGALDQALAADDLQVLQAGGAGGRVARVGEAVASGRSRDRLSSAAVGARPTNTPPSGM